MEIRPIKAIIPHIHLSLPFTPHPPEPPLCFFLEHFPTYCTLILNTNDQSANEIHDFTGRPCIQGWCDYSLCTKKIKSIA